VLRIQGIDFQRTLHEYNYVFLWFCRTSTLHHTRLDVGRTVQHHYIQKAVNCKTGCISNTSPVYGIRIYLLGVCHTRLHVQRKQIATKYSHRYQVQPRTSLWFNRAMQGCQSLSSPHATQIHGSSCFKPSAVQALGDIFLLFLFLFCFSSACFASATYARCLTIFMRRWTGSHGGSISYCNCPRSWRA